MKSGAYRLDFPWPMFPEARTQFEALDTESRRKLLSALFDAIDGIRRDEIFAVAGGELGCFSFGVVGDKYAFHLASFGLDGCLALVSFEMIGADVEVDRR